MGGREKRFGLESVEVGDARPRLEEDKGVVDCVVKAGLVLADIVSVNGSASGESSAIEGRSSALPSFVGVGAGCSTSHCFAIFFSTKATRRIMSNAISPNAI